MRIHKRFFAAFLSFAVVFGSILIMPGVSAASNVGYRISGYYDDASGNYLAQIYIQNVNALGGRFALKFDQSKLTLTEQSSMLKAVKAGRGITITNEGIENPADSGNQTKPVLISQSEGFVMFAWYPSANQGVDASTRDVLIAEIPFKYKSGITEERFDQNTFKLRPVTSGMVQNWKCGAAITASGLIAYTSNATNNDYYCNVTADYPNAELPPQSNTHTVTVEVTDYLGNPLQASVTVDGQTQTASANGRANFQLVKGEYSCRIMMDGYETQETTLTVADSDVTFKLLLRGYNEIVQSDISNVTISYQTGDSASHVSGAIGLPTKGILGSTITWESSRPDIVTSQGIVILPNTAQSVTLYATAEFGEAKAKRPFLIDVMGRASGELSDEERVKQDVANLSIKFAPGDTAASVTTDMLLTDAGKMGCLVDWTSSNEEVIDNIGLVTLPGTAANVTLDANVIRGSAKDSRRFPVTVESSNANETDEYVVNRILNSLEIGYQDGDSKESITQNVSLDTNGRWSTPIIWNSSNPVVLGPNGGIVRQSADTKVTLTATVTRGTFTDKKEFPDLVVKGLKSDSGNNDAADDPNKGEGFTDAAYVQKDKEALEIIYAPGDSADHVTSNLTLPLVGKYGCEITWNSAESSVINTSGEVFRQSGDISVTLTATIRKNNEIDTKTFPVTVLKRRGSNGGGIDEESDEEIVERVANSLQIIYQDGDSASSISKNLTLPAVGAEGAVISWTSSHPTVITPNGNVTRPSSLTFVTLTAKISLNSAQKTKEFSQLAVLAIGTPSGTQVSVPTASPKPELRFQDLDGFEWAQEAILKLADAGVINGTSNTTYSPDAPIIRGDFITLIMRMLKLDGEITETFTDVPSDSYYYQPISLAKSLGIITGVDEAHFEPESFISRQDMMTMTCRALNQLEKLDQNATAELTQFGDSDRISDYAEEFVKQLVGMNLIAGDANGNICPLDNTTRAEAAVFLYRIYSL